jgi:hypothetical protein
VKLALSAQGGVEILSGSGEVTAREMAVLRAGIAKLLKSGKHRIVLALHGADQLPDELIRELSDFDRLARELAGRVVLADATPALREQLRKLGQPPVITAYATVEEAVRSFAAPDVPAHPGTATPGAIAPAAGAAAAAAGGTAATPSPAAPGTAAGAAPASPAVDHEVHKRLSALEEENRALRQQLVQQMALRKTPPNEAAWRSQVEVLEARIEELAKAPAPGGAGGKEGKPAAR